MKKIVILFSILGFLLLISSGCDKSTSPSNDTHHVGWVVGDPEGGYGSIFKTTNSGQTWVRQGVSLTIPNVHLRAVRAVDSLNVWVVGSIADGWATILRTTDGGKTWLRIGSRGVLDDVYLLGLYVVDDLTIWVVGAGGAVLCTQDGGSTWESKTDTSFSYFNIPAIAVHGQNIWACGNGTGNQGGVILRSTDGGNSWYKCEQGSFLEQRGMIDLSAPTDSCVWVVGHGKTILHTDNAGSSWEIQNADVVPSNDANGITAVDENVAWMAADYGVVKKTTDGGDIWSFQTNVPQGTAGYFLYRVSPINKDIAWIAGFPASYNVSGIILSTVDGGETWIRQYTDPNIPLEDVSFVGSYH